MIFICIKYSLPNGPNYFLLITKCFYAYNILNFSNITNYSKKIINCYNDNNNNLNNFQGGQMKTKMCFYIEAKWQASPPTPEDPEVTIEASQPRKVYVHQFGGYAMDDSTWTKQANEFSKLMGKFNINFKFYYFRKSSSDNCRLVLIILNNLFRFVQFICRP